MSIRFVNIDRDTPMLFPVDMRDWLPGNHLVHFIVDAVEKLNVENFKINYTGSGDEQYPPEMMLALIIYCYATGTFSSRRIEIATYTDIAARYICGGTAHPDHTVLCRFRVNNKEAFAESFTKVLVLAQEMGHLKKVGGISVDGTKIHANASKHSAVSYKKAVEMIGEIEKEVAELITKAEQADSTPLEDGLTIPEEIALREKRKAKLEQAKAAMEARYAEAQKAKEELKRAEKERKTGQSDDKSPEKTEQTGGSPADTVRPPAVNLNKPLDEYQYNFTDPESRIMKAGNGKHFEQLYNAQVAVDTETMLAVGNYVTNHGNDKLELSEIVGKANTESYQVETVSADTGFFSEEAIKAVEQKDEAGKLQGPEVYCAVEKHRTSGSRHHRTVQDLEKHEEPEPPPADASIKEQMGHKLKTAKGKAIYKKRKETVEPVFGIIKSAMGFRQFLLRGLEKVNTEWNLVTLAYDFKRLFNISRRKGVSFTANAE
ncbi:IS1182 family transposase ISMac1 [Spirochaetia bacterium]|nr:IS1182 family transposase ISMac1 [Spirochaetia bacterium]